MIPRLTLPLVTLAAVLTFDLPTPAAAAKPPSQYDIYSGKAAEPYYAFTPSWIAPANPEYQRRSEASAVNLKNGDVLVAWCDLVGRSDNAKGYISAVELSPTGEP